MTTQLWIVVTNWRKFQHYRDRRPAWIKLYPELLQNQNYRDLEFFHRALLFDIWLLYAASGCELQASPAKLSRRLGYPTEHEAARRRKLATNSPSTRHQLATELAINSPSDDEDDGERPIRLRDLKRLEQAGFIELSTAPLLAHMQPALAPTRVRAKGYRSKEKDQEHVRKNPREDVRAVEGDERAFDFDKILRELP
jgi:hypothetical protein